MEPTRCSVYAVGNDVERFARETEQKLGARVRELRQLAGWTQDELASRMTAAGCDTGQATVSKIESAGRPTSVGEVATLSKIFGVGIVDLMRRGPVIDDRTAGELARQMGEIEEQAEAVRRELAKIEHDYFVAVKNRDKARAELADLEYRKSVLMDRIEEQASFKERLSESLAKAGDFARRIEGSPYILGEPDRG